MNKYQEALNRVNKAITIALACQGIDLKEDNETVLALKTLQELVGKATPKKVDKNTKGIFPNNDTYLSYHTTYACPNCNCKLHLDWHEKRNYCPECGQKLEWSEE